MCAKDYNTISVFFIIFIDELIDLAYTYFVQHIAMRIRHVSTVAHLSLLLRFLTQAKIRYSRSQVKLIRRVLNITVQYNFYTILFSQVSNLSCFKL